MSGHITNMIERQALRAQHGNRIPITGFFGEVISYDAQTDRVRVRIGNNFDGFLPYESPPIPYVRGLAGNGYGEQSGVEPGVQVLVISLVPEGDVYVAIGLTYTQKNVVPNASIKTGEWQITNRQNTKVAFKNTADGTTQLGDITTITGNPQRIIREKDLVPLVNALNSLVSALNAHTHLGVQTGGGTSGAPPSPFSTFANPTGSNTAKAGD